VLVFNNDKVVSVFVHVFRLPSAGLIHIDTTYLDAQAEGI
jgi:hypothetical protein